jgi:hypothetical protein
MIWLLLGCGREVEEAADCSTGETITAVLNVVAYTRREGNVVWGFNLDDHISDDNDEEGCDHADLVDPVGNEGIDNAFSGLIPALEATEASAVEDLIQDSVNNGQLLLMVSLHGVDDVVNDDCISVEFARADGTPIMGTDGEMLDGQSFARSENPPYAYVESAAIVDGVVDVRGVPLFLPLQVLDVELEFDMPQGALRVDVSEDAVMTGVFGGGVQVGDILRIVEEGDLGDIRELVTGLVTGAADLKPDDEGVCQELSVAFEFQTTPAFFYGE